MRAALPLLLLFTLAVCFAATAQAEQRPHLHPRKVKHIRFCRKHGSNTEPLKDFFVTAAPSSMGDLVTSSRKGGKRPESEHVLHFSMYVVLANGKMWKVDRQLGVQSHRANRLLEHETKIASLSAESCPITPKDLCDMMRTGPGRYGVSGRTYYSSYEARFMNCQHFVKDLFSSLAQHKQCSITREPNTEGIDYQPACWLTKAARQRKLATSIDVFMRWSTWLYTSEKQALKRSPYRIVQERMSLWDYTKDQPEDLFECTDPHPDDEDKDDEDDEVIRRMDELHQSTGDSVDDDDKGKDAERTSSFVW